MTTIKFTAKIENKDPVEIETADNMKVEIIMQKVNIQRQIPIEHQRVVFCGRVLEGDTTLQDAGIPDEKISPSGQVIFVPTDEERELEEKALRQVQQQKQKEKEDNELDQIRRRQEQNAEKERLRLLEDQNRDIFMKNQPKAQPKPQPNPKQGAMNPALQDNYDKLIEMGYTPDRARTALEWSNNNINTAIERLVNENN
ncbi:MAG: hypothetical protein EZS28_004340 [Streblomastix strix]|uniref:UBA domain-containing protein n=1 Tax=Streblomastix strix TaxID=222440 RepID=A0A5J4X0X9_9EUKA|nr:MAG: hypothetical protein EZS28_004340 [Streblomastix strix]